MLRGPIPRSEHIFNPTHTYVKKPLGNLLAKQCEKQGKLKSKLLEDPLLQVWLRSGVEELVTGLGCRAGHTLPYSK
jgi:hypothetical protein